MTTPFDIAVVGGGIVGLATALALTEANLRRRVVVLEGEDALGRHQTGRNSGVIHAGLYYKPGSLKARLCVQGREAMYRFCEEEGVLHEKCGKLVVATSHAELARLAELEHRGRANGVRLHNCGPEEMREHEPHVAGIAGLFVEDTGIVSYAEVLRAMDRVFRGRRGGEVRLGFRVRTIERDPEGFTLRSEAGEERARNLVACAGLQSDRVAEMCGLTPATRILPFRGEYYDLVESRRGLCRSLIYPVPDPRFPFLGVHFTRGTDGVVECGPNAVLSFAREGYRKTSVDPHDLSEMLGFLGFWNLVAEHFRMGAYEMYRSLSKAAFVRALQKLVPEITEADVVPGRTGIRAQAVEPSGKIVDDFRFAEAPGMLHVLNAPSPAATASLAIGRYIASAADRVLR
jgi:L-2-hydroxyglutarate oxidase